MQIGAHNEAHNQMQKMQNPNISHLEYSTKVLLLIAALCVFSFDLIKLYNLWQLTPDGLTLGIKNEAKLPYWDFSNLWTGSLFAREGHINWLFDMSLYRAKLDAFFQITLEPQEWSYPPHILLIGSPLSYLPIFPAYALWTLAGLVAFALSIRVFKFPPIIFVFVLLSPAIWKSLLLGQNGTFVTAILIAGLYYAPKKPILAGILFGFLTMKPHLGILIPFILIASKNWQAFLSASITIILLVFSTYLLFGLAAWEGFFSATRPLMTLILEADFPAPYHGNMITAFALARSLGADLISSYGLQIMFSLGALSLAIWMWRPNCEMSETTRLIVTGLCVLITTPYAYTYDGAIYYVAIAWYLCHATKPSAVPIFILWIAPLYWPQIISLGLPALGIFPLVVMVILLLKTDQSYSKAYAEKPLQ